MSKTRVLSFLFFSVVTGTGILNANTVLFSASGQFSSAGVTTDQLAAPNGRWTMSFDATLPTATNVTTTGFDATFSSFHYSLNGSSVSVSPQNIRFFTTGGGGLFTVYFGPESGYSGTTPIPEFELEGAQLFTGSTSSPTFSTGSFAQTEWIYSDVSNYDDHVAAGVVTAAAVPEPSSFALFAFPAALILFGRVRRSGRGAITTI